MRKAHVYRNDRPAGRLEETERGYRFTYERDYLADPAAHAISPTLPLRRKPFESDCLFPFFYGLLAEGVTKQIQCRVLKLDPDDHFGRLIKTAHTDTIGCVTVREIPTQ